MFVGLCWVNKLQNILIRVKYWKKQIVPVVLKGGGVKIYFNLFRVLFNNKKEESQGTQAMSARAIKFAAKLITIPLAAQYLSMQCNENLTIFNYQQLFIKYRLLSPAGAIRDHLYTTMKIKT